MAPTRLNVLLLGALFAGLFGWALVRLTDSLAGRYVPVTWVAAIAVWLVAGALLWWILAARPRLQRRPGARSLSPQVATRTAALALASSRAGAIVAGAYAGVAVGFLPELNVPAGSSAAIAALVAALGGAAVAILGIWLERLCRIDSDDDGVQGEGPASAGTGPARGE
ncbi:MAG: DUF3180 domain-containing protein [Actinomycetia bacterium]|nr:DUF3180 domain-containing protein [Actinomycetes bacterium]